MTILIQTEAQPGDGATAYDSVWAGQVPVREPDAFERTMLAEDKLYVVLGVVLIIWAGIMYFLLRTDRKLAAMERSLNEELHVTSEK